VGKRGRIHFRGSGRGAQRKSTQARISAGGVCALVLLRCAILGGQAAGTTQVTLYAMAIAFIGNAGYAPVLIFLNESFRLHACSGTGLSWTSASPWADVPTFVSLASRQHGANPDVACDILGGDLRDLLIGARAFRNQG